MSEGNGDLYLEMYTGISYYAARSAIKASINRWIWMWYCLYISKRTWSHPGFRSDLRTYWRHTSLSKEYFGSLYFPFLPARDPLSHVDAWVASRLNLQKPRQRFYCYTLEKIERKNIENRKEKKKNKRRKSEIVFYERNMSRKLRYNIWYILW